jgi:hypothetical protein
MSRMFKLFTSICVICLFIVRTSNAQDFTDSIVAKKEKTITISDSMYMIRFGVDASKFVLNELLKKHKSYEFSIEWYTKKERFWTAEFGFGNSSVDYDYLEYNSQNWFAKIGFDKMVFTRKKINDWSGVFWGLRYGVAGCKRGNAMYKIDDGLGGVGNGGEPQKNALVHWGEVVLGMKVELSKNIFAGWTGRFKLLANPKTFGNLPPYYIAGYGYGDKSINFDFNFFINYSIQWKKNFSKKDN